MTKPIARERAINAYRHRTGREPTLVVRAPGRVNIIGEHTDYNEGFVLPMALPFDVVIAGEPRTDGTVQANSEGFEPIEFSLTSRAIGTEGWGVYVHGTAVILADEGYPVAGWQAELASDIPAGASLSSSAALEVAAGLALTAAAGVSIDFTELARIGQRVENEILGLPSGIMDQLASATSVAGAASLIDCRDLSTAAVPLPSNVDVVIMDTGTRRVLADSHYAARRADCETAAAAIGVDALRDADLEQLGGIDDERVRRRARHVITENRRVLDAATAMRSGNCARLGELMNASHSSLRDDFEVSGPALDAIVALAQRLPGCHGARMTGGGFAGAAVALVDRDATASFVDSVLERYRVPAEQPAAAPMALYAVQPATGASVISSG